MQHATQFASDSERERLNRWIENFPWKPTVDPNASYIPYWHTNLGDRGIESSLTI